MKVDADVNTALIEAGRFVNRAEEWLDWRKGHLHVSYLERSVEHAAMLRASMDLTRALAQLRKGK